MIAITTNSDELELPLLYDPPEGWKYGFPLPITPSTDIPTMLRLQGYPEEDIDFALKHGRYIGTREQLKEFRLGIVR